MKRMRWTAISVFCGFLLAAPVFADVIDPSMNIDSGDPTPMPVSGGVTFTPPGDASDTFDFLNDLGLIITGFKFETTVVTNFTGPLSCSSGYFLHCDVSYTPSSGDLIFNFHGVAAFDNDEVASQDTEANEHEGIPLGGRFHLTINGFDTASGIYDSNADIKPFVGSYTTATPEPSSIGFLAAGLLAMAGALRYRRRRELARASSR